MHLSKEHLRMLSQGKHLGFQVRHGTGTVEETSSTHKLGKGWESWGINSSASLGGDGKQRDLFIGHPFSLLQRKICHWRYKVLHVISVPMTKSSMKEDSVLPCTLQAEWSHGGMSEMQSLLFPQLCKKGSLGTDSFSLWWSFRHSHYLFFPENQWYNCSCNFLSSSVCKPGQAKHVSPHINCRVRWYIEAAN